MEHRSTMKLSTFSPLSSPFSSSRKRLRRILERSASLPSVHHQVFSLVLPFLHLHSSIRSFSAVSKDCYSLVVQHRKSTKEILLDGRVDKLVITSRDAFKDFLTTQFQASKVEKLCIVDAGVRVISSLEEDRGEWELTRADEKARTIVFPLGILSQFMQLTELCIESSSSIATTRDELTNSFGRSINRVVPLQAGLANLHEVADHCPSIEVLRCVHVEMDEQNRSCTDVWGPDCTLALTRKLRVHCPKLRDLGVLSSPGPRMLNEIRRMGTALLGRPITETPEINETYVTSFLTELARFPSNICITVSVTSNHTPGASARSAVRHFRDELVPPLEAMHALGELSDCLELLKDFPASTSLHVIARSTSLRLYGPHVLASMAEKMRLSHFFTLLAEARLPNVRAYDIPGESGLPFPSRFGDAVSPSTKLLPTSITGAPTMASQRIGSFALSVRNEPRAKRSVTDLSSQASAIVERSLSVLEPDEDHAGLLRAYSKLSQEEMMDDEAVASRPMFRMDDDLIFADDAQDETVG